MNLTERRVAATRIEIARVTARMVEASSLDAVTVEAIANATGISSRTFYRYFATKQEAVSPLLAEGSVRWLERIEAVPRNVGLVDALEQATLTTFIGCAGDDDHPMTWTRAILRAAASDSMLQNVWASVCYDSEQNLRGVLARRMELNPCELDVRVAAATASIAVRVAVESWAATDNVSDDGRSIVDTAVEIIRRLSPGASTA